MYIQLVSLHGLLRGDSIEMGRDADTGGQVRYVLELAKTLGKLDQVSQVDLFTRRIRDRRVSPDYGKEIEELGPKCRIVRLPCGGGRYLRKERLWPFVDDYVDAMISFTRRERRTPTLVHGHYADGGYVAKEVASAFDVPFVFTGHSLGKPKLEYLLREGWTPEAVDKELAMSRRIEAEQECLSVADLVITSTRHERDEQYAEYSKNPSLKFEVIAPGTDLERFFPYYEYDMPNAQVDERFKQARMRMANQLNRFFADREKPLIVALCRPDRRKNIGALIEMYGRSKQLQAIANLAVFAGIRQDIESMPDNEQQVLTDMLLAMDRWDLYGKMAVPKNHDSEVDVPEVYRIAAKSRGVFVNSAFIELFGLTAIEAAATGLPFVATHNGGPTDIAENTKSGFAVDVSDQEAFTNAILKLLTEREIWDHCSANGVNLVREQYTWERHCKHYLESVNKIVQHPRPAPAKVTAAAPGVRLPKVDSLLITDIDNTLLGDDAALERLRKLIRENRHRMGFGLASGRALELVQKVLRGYDIKEIDVIIASVGCEIYYGANHVFDKGWASTLRSKWKPDIIRKTLAQLPFLTMQKDKHTQREFKISYDLDETVDPQEALPLIHHALDAAHAPYSLIFSHGVFVDILPHRASKGKAIRYLTGKWNVPIERVATAGDSGNDRDMLLGQTAGIVVGNYAPELEPLKQAKHSRIYFAQAHYADGIIEGLRHYDLLTAAPAKLAG